MNQTCEQARLQFALLIYGELSFDEEEAVESHVASCGECATALERERELLAVFDQVAVEPSHALLSHCREELVARLVSEPVPPRLAPPAKSSWVEKFLDSFTIRVPAMGMTGTWMGAVALLAIGFVSARLVPAGGPMSMAGIAGSPAASRVRYIEPAADGMIQIVLDETRQRTVTGTVADQEIRQYLFDAVRDPDASLRQQTLNILARKVDATQSQHEVRDALMWTMRYDTSPQVRRQALNGLRSFVREGEVRTALAQVLVNDEDQTMRADAINLLLESVTDAQAPVEVVRMLQQSMNREEENIVVRQRVQRALEAMNASAEIY